MNQRSLAALAVILLLGVVAVSEATAGQDNPVMKEPVMGPLRNGDVVAMVKLDLSPEVIVRAIESHTADFDKSSEALISLKQQGVPDAALAAVLKSDGSVQPATNSSPPRDLTGRTAFVLSPDEGRAVVAKASGFAKGASLIIRDHGCELQVFTPIGSVVSNARQALTHPGITAIAYRPSYLKQVLYVVAGRPGKNVQDIVVTDASQKIMVRHTDQKPVGELRDGRLQPGQRVAAEFPLDEVKSRLLAGGKEFVIMITGFEGDTVKFKISPADVYGLQ